MFLDWIVHTWQERNCCTDFVLVLVSVKSRPSAFSVINSTHLQNKYQYKKKQNKRLWLLLLFSERLFNIDLFWSKIRECSYFPRSVHNPHVSVVWVHFLGEGRKTKRQEFAGEPAGANSSRQQMKGFGSASGHLTNEGRAHFLITNAQTCKDFLWWV